nr:MAG TPA: Cytosine specific methyltransferase [Caudoviricetes sp.]
MNELTYATVCSGIECMSAAAIGLPLRPVFFSEIEPFPCAVLKHRYPNVPNLGDMSKIEVNEKGEITNGITTIPIPAGGLDILAGGTPCQDVSNAGKRRGMQEGSGTRSSLAFEFVRLIRELRPRYVVWENVAGVLSDESFPKFLGAIADCGYGVVYRTLDAQYVRCSNIDLPDGGVVRLERAVPQRRRRVWVVGCAGGDVRKASEVLFEPRCVCGDRPPRRVTGQGTAEVARGRARLPDGVVEQTEYDGSQVASTLTKSNAGGCQRMPDKANFNAIIERRVEVYENHAQDCRVQPCGEIAPTLNGTMGTGGNNVPLKAECFGNVSHARGVEMHGVILTNSNGEDVMPTISASEYKQAQSQKDTAGGYVLERCCLSCGEGASPSPAAATDTSCVSPTVLALHGTDPHAVCLGFKSKPSAKTRGIGAEREISPTVTTQFDGAVCFGINANGVTKTAQMPCRKECAETLAVGHQGGVAISGSVSFEPGLAKREGEGHRFSDEVVSTLRAHMGDNLPAVATVDYVVRRLTPTECERLQGLPEGWTLPAFAPDEITDALVAEFMGIHDTFGAVMAGYAGNPPPKPKTAAWVRTWLERIANPATCPDAPRYKACGNGWATNQPRWILMNLLERDSPGWQFECRFAGAAPACRPASGADVYNGQVHDEVADTIGANSGTANTAGGKVIV